MGLIAGSSLSKPACMTSPGWLGDNDLKQNTIYYCACNSAQQSLYELFGIRVPESELAGHGRKIGRQLAMMAYMP